MLGGLSPLELCGFVLLLHLERDEAAAVPGEVQGPGLSRRR